jgi:LL-diaminopimelate aminotransferase
VPWDDCGHFVRFSVTFLAPSESEETSIIEEINRRLSQYTFQF